MMQTAIEFCFLTALASWLLGFGAYRLLASKGVEDRPNDRSSHSKPTVRGGGISFLAAILISVSWILWHSYSTSLLLVMLCVMGLAIVSFIDDLKSLGAAKRFGCHILAAVIALYTLGMSDVLVSPQDNHGSLTPSLSHPMGEGARRVGEGYSVSKPSDPSIRLALSANTGFHIPFLVSAVLGFLWIAGYTNAFNFMDGINGIAGGQAVITAFGMALLGTMANLPPSDLCPLTSAFWSPSLLLCLIVSGAALGFLPHNFPKARMFMGDVGSAPLGFLLAVLALWVARDHGWWLLIPLALLHANFVLDTGITLFRRVLRGDRWYDAHREHFYQRLIRSGKSHTFVTSFEMGLQILVLLLMIVYLHASVPMRMLLVGCVLAIWITFFAYCEYSFKKAQVKPTR